MKYSVTILVIIFLCKIHFADAHQNSSISYNQDRFDSNNEINTKNVNNLKLVQTFDTKILGEIQSSPIVENDTMYISTYSGNVFAYNLISQKIIWHYTYKYLNTDCCGPSLKNRGLAILNDRLYFGTADAHLICLNKNTGRLIWNVKVEDSELKYRIFAAPTAFDNLVIVGLGDGNIRGVVKAYNAVNGTPIWKFNVTPALNARGGGVWNSPSVDTNNNTIFFVTGDPYHSSPDFNRGDNLFTNSLIALDLHTGILKWFYQYIPHDINDLDFGTPTILTNLKGNNREVIPVVISSGKIGKVFIHRRDNGHLIKTSQSMIEPALPDSFSGVSWSPMSFDNNLNYIYALNTFKSGNQYHGAVVATSAKTGKVLWKFKTNYPMVGGVLSTGSGLVFFGDGMGIIRAVNAKNGRVLWSHKVNAGCNSPPISFKVKGKQHIAIGCGGNNMFNFKKGSNFYIFSL